MEESFLRSPVEKALFALVMGLFAVGFLLAGLAIVYQAYLPISVVEVTSSVGLISWAAYGFLLTGFLLLILGIVSIGFENLSFSSATFGVGFIFIGVRDLAYCASTYLAFGFEMSIIFPLVIGILKIIVGSLLVKLARGGFEDNFLIYLGVSLSVFIGLLLKAVAPILLVGVSDYYTIISITIYSMFFTSIDDIFFLIFGGFFSPLVLISSIIGIFIVRRKSFWESYGAKIAFAFGFITFTLGLFLTANYLIINQSIPLLASVLLQASDSAVNFALYVFAVILSLAIFFGLMGIAFDLFANYYILIPTERAEERPLERAIEEVTVVERAEREEREERKREEELEIEEFDLDLDLGV